MGLYEDRVKRLHDHVIKNIKKAKKEAEENGKKDDKESKGAE